MALNPPLAEDILSLLEKYPDLTIVQSAILKSAAAYLVADEMDRVGSDDEFDPRLKLTFEEYEMIPDRIELWDGIPRPKHWETPNRLAAARRYEAEDLESR